MAEIGKNIIEKSPEALNKKQDNDIENEISEREENFTINNKSNIGKFYFDEITITRCAIVKLLLLNYKIKEICQF